MPEVPPVPIERLNPKDNITPHNVMDVYGSMTDRTNQVQHANNTSSSMINDVSTGKVVDHAMLLVQYDKQLKDLKRRALYYAVNQMKIPAELTAQLELVQQNHSLIKDFLAQEQADLVRTIKQNNPRFGVPTLERTTKYMVKTNYISDELDIAIRKNPPRPLWDLYEDTYSERTATAEERQKEIDNVLRIGRLQNEKYEAFADRLSYIFKIYKVDDNCTNTLARLRRTVDPMVRTVMNFMWRMGNPTSPNEKPSSLSDYCKYLRYFEGPDDVVIGKRRNDDAAASQSSSATNHRPSKRATLRCDNCGSNNTHNTANCKRCQNCDMYGHHTSNCTVPRVDNRGPKAYRHSK
ncbi:hypothetical protein BGZ94_009289, partial [Podila epigama]